MGWIEWRGKRCYIMDTIDGKRISIACGTDGKFAKKMLVKMQRVKKARKAEEARKRVSFLYKEGEE